MQMGHWKGVVRGNGWPQAQGAQSGTWAWGNAGRMRKHIGYSLDAV